MNIPIYNLPHCSNISNEDFVVCYGERFNRSKDQVEVVTYKTKIGNLRKSLTNKNYLIGDELILKSIKKVQYSSYRFPLGYLWKLIRTNEMRNMSVQVFIDLVKSNENK